jgi:hypothetical protein
MMRIIDITMIEPEGPHIDPEQARIEARRRSEAHTQRVAKAASAFIVIGILLYFVISWGNHGSAEPATSPPPRPASIPAPVDPAPFVTPSYCDADSYAYKDEDANCWPPGARPTDVPEIVAKRSPAEDFARSHPEGVPGEPAPEVPGVCPGESDDPSTCTNAVVNWSP